MKKAAGTVRTVVPLAVSLLFAVVSVRAESPGAEAAWTFETGG